MNRKFEITDAKRGVAFAVKVITRAQKNGIVGVREDNILKIGRRASPAEGQANSALIKFLAQTLGVAENQIEIVAGADKSDKMISVSGLSTAEVEEKLQRGP